MVNANYHQLWNDIREDFRAIRAAGVVDVFLVHHGSGSNAVPQDWWEHTDKPGRTTLGGVIPGQAMRWIHLQSAHQSALDSLFASVAKASRLLDQSGQQPWLPHLQGWEFQNNGDVWWPFVFEMAWVGALLPLVPPPTRRFPSGPVITVARASQRAALKGKADLVGILSELMGPVPTSLTNIPSRVQSTSQAPSSQGPLPFYEAVIRDAAGACMSLASVLATGFNSSVPAPSPLLRLTESQRNVYHYLLKNPGRTAKEIAKDTQLAKSTVERHILPKLRAYGVKNRCGAGYFVDEAAH